MSRNSKRRICKALISFLYSCVIIQKTHNKVLSKNFFCFFFCFFFFFIFYFFPPRRIIHDRGNIRQAVSNCLKSTKKSTLLCIIVFIKNWYGSKISTWYGSKNFINFHFFILFLSVKKRSFPFRSKQAIRNSIVYVYV